MINVRRRPLELDMFSHSQVGIPSHSVDHGSYWIPSGANRSMVLHCIFCYSCYL
jgi:hypothetical protein